MADRVTEPLPHVRRLMLPVDPDDPDVMDHLDQYHHVVRRLNNLIIVVVQDRKHRWSGSRSEAEQATLAERPVFHAVKTVETAHAGGVPLAPARDFPPRADL